MKHMKCPFAKLTSSKNAKVSIFTVVKNRIHLVAEFGKKKSTKSSICGPVRVLYDVLVRRDVQLRDIDIERMRKYGDTYLLFMGFTPVVIVTTADLTEEISKKPDVFLKSDPRELNMPYFYKWVGNNNIVLSNGVQWDRLRRIITPAVNSVHFFTPIFVQKSLELLSSVNEIVCGDNGSQSKVYLSRWLKAVSLDAAGKSLFGYDFSHLKEVHNPGIDAMDYVVKEIFNPLRRTFPIANKLPTKSNKRLIASMSLLDQLVENMIDYLIKNKDNIEENGNILQLLIKGNDEEVLDRDGLRNNILAMVLASHETTQVSLGGVLYYLAKYPQWQRKLRDEIINLFDDIEEDFRLMAEDNLNKKNITLQKLMSFRAMDNFILETLRHYSPLAHQNPRTTACETTLGGRRLPKGTLISINIHAVHMNPKEWQDSAVFNPDRFNNQTSENRYAYLPFGSPPRVCSGKKFTILEQKIILCYLLKDFKIELPVPGYELPLERNSFTGMHQSSFHLSFSRL